MIRYLTETPSERLSRKLATITLPELEDGPDGFPGFITAARERGDHETERAGVRRKLELQRGRG